ncbi:protein-tyrosine phosphatase [Myroides phaeus]|uniref:Protein-tyrosine phosphatase n=2 Tax=Myroides phaeus TaxID=702745 RepID=A0A1G8B4X9_9FLAO|nr:protein-tyrosine phosphatase [Myroides phaeus]
MLMGTKGSNQTIDLKTDKKNNKTIAIIKATQPWKLYKANSSFVINANQEIASGNSNDFISLETIPSFQLFALGNNKNFDFTGLRCLPLEGQNNFRDLGGYKTIEGKTVKWGLLFRSGQLSELTDNDLCYLSSIPLRTIVDFRTNEERDSQITRLPSSTLNDISLPISPGNLSREIVENMIYKGNVEKTIQFLTDINEQLILTNQEQYKAFFTILQKNTTPLMYNCTAGKDRTGLATALLLSALGVDNDTILADYLLTNTFVNLSIDLVKDKYLFINDKQAEALMTLQTVKKEYLLKALETINQHYNSVESYLTNQLAVDIPLMKELYLY